MNIPINLLIISITTSYHFIASILERRKFQPPGKLIDIGGYKLHLYSKGTGKPTVIIDHSLGGIDGYFLIDELAEITQVCICDRAGYGWSDSSPKPRSSQTIVRELDPLLNLAKIEPPYILVGDSFGSYNVRLYAHQFPEKVIGIVLADGLHETGILNMSLSLRALKLFFMSGFLMSIFGSIWGIVRILGTIGIFELLKQELRKFPKQILQPVKISFYHYQHWLTMWREMWNLNASSRQVSQANNFGDLPIINIKAKTFFKRSIWNFYLPITAADKLRDKMHCELLKLSTNCTQIQASKSSHFVWIDEPEIILAAIQQLLANR
ncbi:alpha/beta hydrolase [Oscillatoria salina]|uniref:alpha/beta hydrolase n=1 Tax=Oscillatoria salina TaxID=331517 RepID=UPI0013B62D51|nr:alpha/beta hydrolase [Oscillatoria salina]MBZ8179520.1 alpha/beta hydrolase [Oscillatoria salina IIICB1]NET91003.1 alpha/beta hydrolase [Kamptonema sp. SIO1D9]